MKKLDKKNYSKVLEPLSKLNFNTQFAKTVLDNNIKGNIYVDNADSPNAFYIAHPYGMSLLFGDSSNKEFINCLYSYITNSNNVRNKREWLQAYPKEWKKVFKDILGSDLIHCDDIDTKDMISKISNKVMYSTRLNFKFDYAKYKITREKFNLNEYNIVLTTIELFNEIQGSVVPKAFWENAQQFIKFGKGFTLLYEDAIASTAFASFINKTQLELGIETVEKYRGLGFASLVCVKLIDYCLEKNLEPVWSCNKTNVGSSSLAQKLGFEQTVTLPYYKLMN